MPYDASGNFNRVHDWTIDRDANIKIQAARMDQDSDDFAAAFNQVMLRSGVAPMSGDLDIGQNGIIGLKNGTVGSPAIQFDNDTTTGFYLGSTGRLALTAGGVKRFEIDSAGAEVFGTLDVSGITALSSNLTVAGNTTIAGTLTVTGVVTLTAPLASAVVTGNIAVGGTSTLTGNVTTGGFLRSASGANNITVQNDGTNSDITATGPLRLYAGGATAMTFFTNGVQRLQISSGGDVAAAGSVNVSGALTLGTPLALAQGGVEATTASGARTKLEAAAKLQTLEGIGGFFSLIDNKDYRIIIKAPHGGTITETTTRCASGTCTATFKINTTALGGTANSVSNSEQSQAHASANTFAAGDDIVITISSNATCQDMSFMIKYTRDLQ
jgi:hypothetical protein